MIGRRLHVAVALVALALLAACGPSARTRTLHTTLATVDATRAGFIAYDDQQQAAIIDRSTSFEDGRAHLEAYRAARAGVVLAFEAAYRAIALALVDKADVGQVLTAALRLREAVDALRAWRLPEGTP